ncbi:hypothetical protein Poli38472_005936 [Pythium oligandrum]|uniref:Putative restriction endonuclease domain-containing protein n=1 Tax=Pythium oligandrum TaxID=41045 RepID=A0A8K1CUG5_PYTOL|nr:hypothetical protein Poli38472_005936 [Pythium oligandrum]|eukprot:TMW68468.1 hypothetical protein Poli38472_005936 [Pythium oligandrum]
MDTMDIIIDVDATSDSDDESSVIALLDGTQIPAVAGRRHILPPPDPNALAPERSLFFLEYDVPDLIVRDVALPYYAAVEVRPATLQAYEWFRQHRAHDGFVGYDRCGYTFVLPPPIASVVGQKTHYRQQYRVPDVSYVEPSTWSQLSREQKNTRYLTCVPTVVVLIRTPRYSMQDLHEKMTAFLAAGTKEGVLADTKIGSLWLYHPQSTPQCVQLGPVAFESWPEFILDCQAIRDARLREERRAN